MMKKMLIFIPLLCFLLVSSLLGADILGDANNDVTVDIVDALLAAQYYVGLNPVPLLKILNRKMRMRLRHPLLPMCIRTVMNNWL